MAGELATQVANMTLGGADAGDGEGVMRSASRSLFYGVPVMSHWVELRYPTCADVPMQSASAASCRTWHGRRHGRI